MWSFKTEDFLRTRLKHVWTLMRSLSVSRTFLTAETEGRRASSVTGKNNYVNSVSMFFPKLFLPQRYSYIRCFPQLFDSSLIPCPCKAWLPWADIIQPMRSPNPKLWWGWFHKFHAPAWWSSRTQTQRGLSPLRGVCLGNATFGFGRFLDGMHFFTLFGIDLICHYLDFQLGLDLGTATRGAWCKSTSDAVAGRYECSAFEATCPHCWSTTDQVGGSRNIYTTFSVSTCGRYQERFIQRFFYLRFSIKSS